MSLRKVVDHTCDATLRTGSEDPAPGAGTWAAAMVESLSEPLFNRGLGVGSPCVSLSWDKGRGEGFLAAVSASDASEVTSEGVTVAWSRRDGRG